MPIVDIASSNSYFLYFDTNGGNCAPETYSYRNDSNSTHIFTIPYKKPYKNGYNFLGWSTNRYATTPTYNMGDKIECLPGTTTLYAIWETIEPDWMILVKNDQNVWVNIPTGSIM